MRLPNGYGTVRKLSGNRRNPYQALITTRWTDQGIQVRKSLGFFKTRAQGYAALADYHANPYNFDALTITFREIYERVYEQSVSKLSHSSHNGYTAAFKKCTVLYNMPFVNIKSTHLQACIDGCGAGYGTRRKIRVLFRSLYKYAMANDIIQKDYSKYVQIGSRDDDPGLPHIPVHP